MTRETDATGTRSTRDLRGRALWWRWWRFTAAGEALGFLAPSLAGLLAFRYAPAALEPALVLAGAVEGAVLGVAQALALRPVLAIPVRAWASRTSTAAAAAWAIGLLPSTLLDAGVPVAIVLVVMVPLAPVLLLSIGVAQWTLLRRYVEARARWWIAVNGVAWLIALPPTFIIPALMPDGAPAALILAGWVLAGALMAAILAAVTGLGLVRMLEGHERA